MLLMNLGIGISRNTDIQGQEKKISLEALDASMQRGGDLHPGDAGIAWNGREGQDRGLVQETMETV